MSGAWEMSYDPLRDAGCRGCGGDQATKQAANGEKKKARAPPKTLWTSLQERNRWIAKVSSS